MPKRNLIRRKSTTMQRRPAVGVAVTEEDAIGAVKLSLASL
jgi:hypothetical protein